MGWQGDIILNLFKSAARLALTAFIGLSLLVSARAQELVISTNNTPMDRKALELISKEAFRRIGVDSRVVGNPSERSLYLANQGEVDGEGLRIAGLGNQYPNLVQVPERFIGISFVAFAKDPQINLNQGWASINPYRISFITGWKMFEANATNARSITKVDTPEQMFKMLDSNRIDLALYTRTDGIALVERMGLPSIAPLAPSLRDVDMYLYLNKRHEALVPKLAQALRYMKTDGALNKILSSLKSE